MRVDSTFRVMWLLNHTSARNFEIPMLKKIGVEEIFTPKIVPADISFRSASVDFSEDKNLGIPYDVLAHLNAVNWYESASAQDWKLASKYFDVCFFIAHDVSSIKVIARNFDGVIIWRAYGLSEPTSYSYILKYFSSGFGAKWLKSLGERFFFGQAYPHLASIEASVLSSRALYLPLGMPSVELKDGWCGSERKIFFVCPDIAFNSYYENIYKWFTKNFSGFPYVIGGSQPVSVEDPNVLGYVPAEEHERNMRQMRLMFYHSQEKYHIHFHPFEAVRSGMPLIFMAGGMLDRFGGEGLPGRCQTIEEARNKIKRLLDGDLKFIEEVRASQAVLLEAMRLSNLERAWGDGFLRIREVLDKYRKSFGRGRKPSIRRIAVVLPAGYKGGSLRGAKLIAEAIHSGSLGAGEPAEVVFAHLDKGGDYSAEDFDDLPANIKRRPFSLREMNAAEARRAMLYSGHDDWEPSSERYLVFDDGIKQFMDCDLWLIVSDRLLAPILPLRPIAHMVYDYLQRYEPILTRGADQPFIDAARIAERVFVTTEFTRQDALQYGGVSPQKLVKLPMLSPRFSRGEDYSLLAERDYFVWTTNTNPHKNHDMALQALKIYYDEFGGGLRCTVTGVNTESFMTSSLPHFKSVIVWLKSNKGLLTRLTFSGNLPDEDYRRLLSGAAFLWHPGRIDNGTFSVIEAASLGVPALSSDYPAMREIDAQFRLNLMWQQADDPRSMANAMWEMERYHVARRENLPTAEELASQDTQQLAGDYWRAIRECL